MKTLLSGPPIKRTPSIKQTQSQVPKSTSFSFLYNEPLFSGHLYQADADTKINCEHRTELTIVALDYVLNIRIVVD